VPDHIDSRSPGSRRRRYYYLTFALSLRCEQPFRCALLVPRIGFAEGGAAKVG
jgi:hypothetical protein